MGQAFRRASGRIRATSSSDATSSKNVVDRNPAKNSVAMEEASNQKPTKITVDAEEASKIEQLDDSMDSDGTLGRNTENGLEERDPQYDAMLNLMVGRIRTKPGGKPEMGEASVVEKYRRPLPKLRNTKPDLNRYEEMATPAGTLNVAQLRQIILLHEGKSEDHDGPMEVRQIAQRFRVEAEEIQRILQFVSLPQESDNKD